MVCSLYLEPIPVAIDGKHWHLAPRISQVASVPLIASHRSILEGSDEVSVPLLPSATSSGTRRRVFGITSSWWRIVCRTWLQSNRRVWIQVACHSLYTCWNTSLLLIHSRCALASSACSGLSIQRLLRMTVALLLWQHPHCRRRICGLGRIWRRLSRLIRGIDVIVYRRRRLRLLILVHLHSVGGLRCSVLLCLSLDLGSLRSLPLLADGLSLLLLLHTRGRGTSRRRSLEIHGWHKGLCELLLCNEGMQLGLLWRPALQGVYVEQTSDEVNKGNSIVELCGTCQIMIALNRKHLPRSTSAGFMFFRGMA